MFPHLRILATGSSTLAASKKFRGTLAGRKREVHLVPVLWSELAAFGATLPVPRRPSPGRCWQKPRCRRCIGSG